MTIDDWRARYDGLNAENDRLRVLLAASNANCAFCGLPAAEMAKCASGFPGCSRADDMLLCEHPTRQDLLEENERLREHEARARWCENSDAEVVVHRGNNYDRIWTVVWTDGDGNERMSQDSDRNAAIDAARGKA